MPKTLPFSRDTIDSLLYTRKLLEYDVCVYFTSDNIITASNDGELRLTIMSSMAQDEVRKLSERTKFGFKRSLENLETSLVTIKSKDLFFPSSIILIKFSLFLAAVPVIPSSI